MKTDKIKINGLAGPGGANISSWMSWLVLTGLFFIFAEAFYSSGFYAMGLENYHYRGTGFIRLMLRIPYMLCFTMSCLIYVFYYFRMMKATRRLPYPFTILWILLIAVYVAWLGEGWYEHLKWKSLEDAVVDDAFMEQFSERSDYMNNLFRWTALLLCIVTSLMLRWKYSGFMGYVADMWFKLSLGIGATYIVMALVYPTSLCEMVPDTVTYFGETREVLRGSTFAMIFSSFCWLFLAAFPIFYLFMMETLIDDEDKEDEEEKEPKKEDEEEPIQAEVYTPQPPPYPYNH